jgi:bacterioferritin-associated ferredoxin
MFVCICGVVTERDVRAAIDAGATSVEAVIAACAAGGDCGACHAAIEEMIEDRRSDGRTASRSLPIAGRRET